MIKITKKVELGEIIKRLMEVHELSNAELSKRSGVSRNQIIKLKKNQVTYINGMRLSTMHALAEALEVPPRLFYKAPYTIEMEDQNGE